MQTALYILASTEVAQKASLFESLGIDWKMLVLQSVAFLLLLWLLSKFVYPVLNKMIDTREAAIAAGQESAKAMQAQAAKAEEKMKALMQDAQKEASEIVATAKSEASDMVGMAEEKAKANAERIVAQAQESIAKDVAAANAGRLSAHVSARIHQRTLCYCQNCRDQDVQELQSPIRNEFHLGDADQPVRTQ